MLAVNLEYSDLQVLLPNIEFFIEKILHNEIFNFIRINHGGIDKIYHAYISNFKTHKPVNGLTEEEAYKLLDYDLRNRRYGNLSNALIKSDNISLVDWHGDFLKSTSLRKNFSEKIKIWFKVLNEYKTISENFYIGISLGVGLHDYWGVFHKDSHIQNHRNYIAKTLMYCSSGQYYYSGAFKHYTITKEIYSFFDILNQENFKVIFLGPEYFRLYESLFNINDFYHIEIPTSGAIKYIDLYIQDIINQHEDNTIVFTSCGHILSAYIAYKLKDMKIFTIDIGRSLDILIKNHLTTESTMTRCWTFLDEKELLEYVKKTRT